MRFFAAMLLLVAETTAVADTATVAVAVASNFHGTAQQLGEMFRSRGDYGVSFSSASTGKLYAQIMHGAPFDIFLAADAERPRLLEENGKVVPGTRFAYAIGRLTLWSAAPALRGKDCLAALKSGNFNRLAIANPRTAPYGVAAEQVLAALNLADKVRDRLLTGENISQTLQYAATGGATFAFVAEAQLHADSVPAAACSWSVDPALHDPVEQQAVLLVHGADNPAARAFYQFLQTPEARAAIKAAGYSLPAPGQ